MWGVVCRVWGGRGGATGTGGDGSFVFADGTGVTLTSSIPNEFKVRAQGGFSIDSSSATFTGGVIFAAQTKAQLEARTSLAGEVFYCSDCSNAVHMVVGTTTLSGYDSFIGGTAWH